MGIIAAIRLQNQGLKASMLQDKQADMAEEIEALVKRGHAMGSTISELDMQLTQIQNQSMQVSFYGNQAMANPQASGNSGLLSGIESRRAYFEQQAQSLFQQKQICKAEADECSAEERQKQKESNLLKSEIALAEGAEKQGGEMMKSAINRFYGN